MSCNFNTKSKTTLITFVTCSLLANCSFSHAQTNSQFEELNYSNNAPTDSLQAIQPLSNDSLDKDTIVSEDALKSKVTYNAKDSIRIDLKNERVYLFGKSEVFYEKTELKSEEIIINMDSNIVSATGKLDSNGNYFGEPVFIESGQEVKSHEMKYNFKTKKGVIIDAVTHEGENYIHGSKIYKTPDDILFIRKGKYTTCNNDHPHYFFSTNKLKIIPEDKIVTGPANLVIENVPTPLAIPFGFFPNSNKQKSGIIVPEPGESGQYGFFLLNGGYYLALSKNISSQITGDYYTKGSWATNLLTNYKKRYKFTGNFNFNYSIFKNGIKDFPDYSETTNFFVKWNHTQDPKARPNSVFSANVNFGNSENYTNNFNSTGTEYLSTTFNSTISYKKSWTGKPFNLSLNGYHNQNTINKTVTLRLPEVAFNVSRIYPFKGKTVGKQKFYEKIGLSYSMNTKNELTAADTLFTSRNLDLLSREFKNGMKHSIPLNTSFKLLKNLTVNPAFNYSEIWYLESINKVWNNQTDELDIDTVSNFVRGNSYNMSVNLTTKIFGIYQYRSKVIKALRHVITPSIGFSYVPENKSGLRNYTDSANITHEYSIFENGIYGASNTEESGLVNLGLLNNFEIKARNRKDSLGKDTKIKLLENLNFTSSYNVAADSLNWSNIQITARTRILKKISLNFNANVDPYALDSNTVTGQISKVNRSEWKENGRIGRVTSSNVAVGFTLRSKSKANEEEKNSEYGTREELEYIRANPHAYVDFNVPWTLNANYNVRYSKPQYKSDLVQTLNFSGDFSLTEKWKIGFNSGYDFESKELSYTSVNFYRDLHCWEMTFNWIPFGPRQSYLFTIKVKSSILQDLKLTRRNLPNVF